VYVQFRQTSAKASGHLDTWEVIIKVALKDQRGRVQAGFIWNRTGRMVMTFRLHKTVAICWAAGQLLASQRLNSTELVCH
jgi:hypothetical protein